MSSGNDPTVDGPKRNFATTHWSTVRAAGDDDSGVAKSALQQLCQTYWYPMYAYLRQQGYQADAAADLTQGFFADLLERKDITRVKRELGRFRSFLLASLKHFVINQWDRQRAQKRGGVKILLSIDFRTADDRFCHEPHHEMTPDRVYEKQWALTLLDRTRAALRREMERRGKAHQFDQLQVFLAGKSDEGILSDVARKLEMSEVAAKVAVHRMRQRFGELLRAEIRQTVDSPADVDAEIQELFETLRS
jgi:RNA polymerase sigma-70 factor (ECF subfamily)